MTALKAAKTVYAPFANDVCWERIRYDASKDSLTTGAKDILTAGSNLMIVHAHMQVIAAVVGSSSTVKFGMTDDDDVFCTATQGAEASLTTGATVVPLAIEGTPNALPLPIRLDSGDKLLMTIGTASLTAGVVEFVVGYIKC